jgi:hypothetical protein
MRTPKANVEADHQIYPETKKHQYKQALDAYEAALRDGRAPDPAGAGGAGRAVVPQGCDAGNTDAMFSLGALLAEQGEEVQPCSGTARPSTLDVVMDGGVGLA